jgi:pSer/pThr/pTyr-binding forkhead associated (FHA) protein
MLKWYHILHTAVTLLLTTTLVVICLLGALGFVQFRLPNKHNKGNDPVGPKVNGGAKARLIVIRGVKANMEYPIREGANIIGRADDKPVDIDLFAQESPQRIWASRQHAVVTGENGKLFIEDLNSTNGTFVNEARVRPPQKQELHAEDIIQIGEVHFKVEF